MSKSNEQLPVTVEVNSSVGAIINAEEVDKKAEEREEQIAHVMDLIADGDLSPRKDAPWAGRRDLVFQLKEKFSLSDEDANDRVNAAVEQITSPFGANVVEKRKLLYRLNQYRQIALKAVNEPNAVETWRFKVKVKDGNPVMNDDGTIASIPVPEKKIVKKGKNLRALRLAMEIEERIIAIIEGATGGDGDLTAEIFERISRDSDGNVNESIAVSMSQKHRKKGVDQLSDRAKKLIAKAVKQSTKQKKHGEIIEGEIVKGGDSDEDSEEAAGEVSDGTEGAAETE